MKFLLFNKKMHTEKNVYGFLVDFSIFISEFFVQNNAIGKKCLVFYLMHTIGFFKQVKIVQLDLEDLQSVRFVASELLKSEPYIDYLINNAGILI